MHDKVLKLIIKGKGAPCGSLSAGFLPYRTEERAVSRSGADVPPGDKREPPAESLCHIKASSPLLNCDMQPFICTVARWLVGGGDGGATDGLWFVGFPALSWGGGFPLLPHIITGGVSDIPAAYWRP